MKILFLTVVKIDTLKDRSIYTDLLRKFTEAGDEVFVVSPLERRYFQSTCLISEGNAKLLRVKTLNYQKINLVEKGIAILTIEYLFLYAIKKYFSKIKFDIVLYSTPPITFYKAIKYIKDRDNAYCYLLLKDIFPQNAVDMGMLKKGSLLHRFFLKKERKLYGISDKIGCLSEANRIFLLNNNKFLIQDKIEINPNSIEPIIMHQSDEDRDAVKARYGLPLHKKIFVYGGNLGKPQGIDFLLETIESNTNPDVFFLVVGSGTEYNRIYKWFQNNQPQNAVLLSGLPKKDYDMLLIACDVGMIFLHKDFTIPNFPSRLLSYLEMKIPVIAATDSNTDIGTVIENNKCGYWVLSGDIVSMQKAIDKICNNDSNYDQMRKNAWSLLQKEYHVDYSYQLINNSLKNV